MGLFSFHPDGIEDKLLFEEYTADNIANHIGVLIPRAVPFIKSHLIEFDCTTDVECAALEML